MTTPFDMFDTAISEERFRKELNETCEESSAKAICLWTEKFNIGHEDATMIVRFSEDIIGSLFYYADTADLPLCVRHMDGTSTTREEQFDLMFMASLPEYRSRIVPELLMPNGDVFDTAYAVEETVQGTKYIRVETLREVRRALLEVPGCSPATKDRAIRQVFDDFIQGLRDDEDVSMTIDDGISESQWELALFCRPSNQASAAALLVEHAGPDYRPFGV